MSDIENRQGNGKQNMQDSDFRPRALAEMAAAIRSANGAQDGSDDMADLIALGGGLEALDAVIASLGDGQKFDSGPGREAQEMAHVMAALTDDLARAKAEKAAEKTETVTERVPELAT